MKFVRLSLGFLALSSFLSVLPLAHAATPDKKPTESKNTSGENLTGLWKNQRGSTLEITRDGSDNLKGHFTTAVANTRACIGHPVPFRGTNNGNALSISMSLESCGSPTVIALSGIVMEKDGREQLKTQALIQYKGMETWNSQVLTSDFYTRAGPLPAPKEAKK